MFADLRLARAVAFLSAALLFALQLLTAREYLAVFGGSFAIWGILAAGFQLLLVFSYSMASALLRKRHVGRIFAVLALLVWSRLSIVDLDDSCGWLWANLILRVAPFAFALGLTSVALEHLYSQSEVSDLYAYSNRGSIAGLALYSLALEPWTSLPTQRVVFATSFSVLAVLWCILQSKKSPVSTDETHAEDKRPWTKAAAVAFVGSFLASALTLSTTQLLTLDVGNFPLIWAIPLAILLLAFAQAFGTSQWPRWISQRLLWVALGFGLVFFLGAANVHTHLQLWVECVVLWVFANALLDRVRDARPLRRGGLRHYFVALALGGALGSTVVGLLMPVLTDRLVEYPILLIVSALLLHLVATDAKVKARTARPWLSFAVFSLVLFLAVFVVSHGRGSLSSIAHARSPYGIYRVTERSVSGHRVRELIFGTTQHGREDLNAYGVPQSYFHQSGPLATIWRLTPTSHRNVAVVGLGVGAIAAYIKPGDTLTYFELDPQIERLARTYFSFLAHPEGQVSVVIGDARLRLREVPRDSMDLIIVDAFSGDSIPLHLLTLDAIFEYSMLLRSGGIIAFHLSNRYFRLAPFVASAGRTMGDAYHCHTLANLVPGEDPSEWVVLMGWEQVEQAAALLQNGSCVPLYREEHEPFSEGNGVVRFLDDHAEWLRALR